MRKNAINPKNSLPFANSLVASALAASILVLAACTQPQSMVTIADARNNPAKVIDMGETGDSMGDMLVFDQPLLEKTTMKSVLIAAPAYVPALVIAFNANGH